MAQSLTQTSKTEKDLPFGRSFFMLAFFHCIIYKSHQSNRVVYAFCVLCDAFGVVNMICDREDPESLKRLPFGTIKYLLLIRKI